MPNKTIYYDKGELELEFFLQGDGVAVQMTWDGGCHSVNLDVADLEELIEDLKLFQDLLFEKYGKS